MRRDNVAGGENAGELMLSRQDVDAFLQHEDKTASAMNEAIIAGLSVRVDAQAKLIRRLRLRISVLLVFASLSMLTRWIARRLLPRPRS